ncbi:peptidoglycan-binding protein [Streptomyces hainanensis]|uniref:N-acetylmuramoyl-L-alanine amidase n=1 Tax=Streptomyces hainanensis TaxID=402648 RepID=A0A4R4TN30_9ACTN|nr:peptidoglycan-binding protein [Streptomyces hainanensis]TDC77274.1 N-acetylmuramoyl-L-alanine amidase [Streptomyces hainanensis]
MARPLSADRLVEVLREEGVTVVEHRAWRTHNRDARGAWGPVNGVMIHHTVTRGTRNSVELCYNGRPDLPGPLCHGLIAKDGTVYLVGNGRANHAGLGDPDVLTAVVDESPAPPARRAAIDGNARFYGFECVNLGDGADPWPAAQLDAVERTAAALCRVHGWTERSVIGHLEWQPGKIDPRGFAMADLRGRAGERLSRTPEQLGEEPESPTEPTHEPFPGADFFAAGRRSPVVTAMGHRLVAVGCGRYRVGPGPDWTDVDRASYAAWQRKLGYSGRAADGIPGRASWERLAVPRR